MRSKPGGYRPGSGRKRIGPSRTINLALPKEIWDEIDNEGKPPAVIRRALIEYYSKKNSNS